MASPSPRVASLSRRLFAVLSARSRVNYLLNLCLFVGAAAVIFSGILISQKAIPTFTGKAAPDMDWRWDTLHNQFSQAVLFLNQANLLVALDTVVWDTSWLLSDGSLFGKALRTLVGYTDRPTEMQLIAYAVTLAVTFVLMRVFAPARRLVPGH